MRLSVLIPTFKRPQHLARALAGLAAQRRPADEIVLGLREGDAATTDFLAGQNPAPRVAPTAEPGVLASMTAAADAADGDVLCLLDDDAEPLPDWLERIEKHFSEEPDLGLLGGRDLLQDHPEMRKNEPLLSRVGEITWYGRILGNHHRGGGRYREVDLIKGCNAAIRADLLRRIGFASGLRGQGAQVHWELALSLDVRNLGSAVRYDPALQVIHHVAPRHDADRIHRGEFSATGLYDMVWNEHYVIASRGSLRQRLAHRLWAFFVGTRTAPGCVQYLRLGLEREPHRAACWRATRRASRDARKEPGSP